MNKYFLIFIVLVFAGCASPGHVPSGHPGHGGHHGGIVKPPTPDSPAPPPPEEHKPPCKPDRDKKHGDGKKHGHHDGHDWKDGKHKNGKDYDGDKKHRKRSRRGPAWRW